MLELLLLRVASSRWPSHCYPKIDRVHGMMKVQRASRFKWTTSGLFNFLQLEIWNSQKSCFFFSSLHPWKERKREKGHQREQRERCETHLQYQNYWSDIKTSVLLAQRQSGAHLIRSSPYEIKTIQIPKDNKCEEKGQRHIHLWCGEQLRLEYLYNAAVCGKWVKHLRPSEFFKSTNTVVISSDILGRKPGKFLLY